VETKEEAIAILKNAIANSQTTLVEIAKGVGLEALLRNETDEQNAALVVAVNAKLGDKPLEKLEAILVENSAAQAAVIEKAVETVAGPRLEKNAKNEDVANPAHAYAAKACEGLSDDALKNAVEGLKKDPVILALNAQRADGDSPLYRVDHRDASDAEANESGDGIPTIRIKG